MKPLFEKKHCERSDLFKDHTHQLKPWAMLEKKLVKYAKQAYIKKIQELFFDDQFLIWACLIQLLGGRIKGGITQKG
jgi:hypothetical protein